MKTLLAPLFGKYRDLVLAIGLFLVIDAGVSAINIYTSRQIETDTRLINTAGLLRTYSQQLTKGLLTLDMDLRNEALTQSSLAEISEARLGFDDARQALLSELSKPPALTLIEPATLREEALEKLKQVVHTWEPIEREVGPLIVNAAPDSETTARAVQKAVTRNNRLTQQADDLSHSLEDIARQKTSTVRVIQAVAISLAFLNFGFIVFTFIGRLLASDRQITRAREESERILGAVHEGLFLLTAERTVGHQRSASLDRLFDKPLLPGTPFNDFLAHITSTENSTAAEDYIDLLFNPKMKQSLLKQLNPLQEIELLGKAGAKQGPTHLSFEFDQIRENGQVVALLVSVFDVSQKLRLERELAGAEARADSEMALLLGVLDHNPNEVAAFLHRAKDTLQLINGELQNIQPSRQAYPQLVNRIARTVHGIKGEAGTLGCASISRVAHEFEDELQPMRQRTDLAGDDLIPVAVALSRLLGEIAKVEAVIKRIQKFANDRRDEPPGGSLGESLQRIEQFALKIAEDLNKQVRFEGLSEIDEIPPSLSRLLGEIVPQLIRNAVVHGIEAPEQRRKLGKPESGLIRVEVSSEADGALTVAVHDDGCGLSPQYLRQVLSARQRYPAEQIAAMSDDQIIATLFEPGFSSLDAAHEHAGRGDGLFVVKEALRELGGRLRISSRPNSHTRFILQFKTA